MERVTVALSGAPYDVVVGPGVLDEAGAVLAGRRRVAVVSQAGVADWHAPALTASLHAAGVQTDVFLIDDGEAAKTLATVDQLCSELAAWGLLRGDAIVALGGGVVGDTAGFAASVYHRGIAVVQAPTTLLAQVDAAIGGKTGVNLPEGKNLVGAIWQPAAVLCDTEVLEHLPPLEYRSGCGEVAKYQFLGGGDLLDLPLDERVARCVEVKASYLVDDERDEGRRALLNYGHTLAHALEATQDADDAALRHGEAVAVGLAFAARLAQRLDRVDERRVAAHDEVLEVFGLDGALPPGRGAAALLEAMRRDKKAHHDLTFVLDGPSGIGVVDHVADREVLATLRAMGAEG